MFDGATRDHFGRVDPPHVEEDRIAWGDVELTRRTPEFGATLLESPDGSVNWQCVMPSADARLRVGDRELHGRGYAEILTMTLPPWKLPIDELRWGRFIGDAHSIVWIDWRGRHPLTLILRDGVTVEGLVRDDEVTSGDVALSISDSVPIRAATLGESLPRVAAVLPGRLGSAKERKWCSRSTVRRGTQVIDRGWVVHEVVTFV